MYSSRRMHSDISLGFLGPSSILCCGLLQRTNAPAAPHPPADRPLPPFPDGDVLDLGGDDLPVPAPAPAALVHPPDSPAPAAVIAPLPAPPVVHPAPPALHDHSRSPSPPAPRCTTRQRFEPRPYWISNAPLVPIHHDPPQPPASSDQDSYHQDSEDEQGAEIAHQVWGSVLEAAGIYPEYVEMEIDDARELAYSAAHQANAASSELPVPKTFKQAMAGAEKAQWEEACQQEITMPARDHHASKRSLRTWRMVLGDLLSSLMAALLLDHAGYSTSSVLQMGPPSATKLVWLPKGSPNDPGGTTSSPLHPPSDSLSYVLSLHLLLQMTSNVTPLTLPLLS